MRSSASLRDNSFVNSMFASFDWGGSRGERDTSVSIYVGNRKTNLAVKLHWTRVTIDRLNTVESDIFVDIRMA